MWTEDGGYPGALELTSLPSSLTIEKYRESNRRNPFSLKSFCKRWKESHLAQCGWQRAAVGKPSHGMRGTPWSSWTKGAGTLAGGCGVRNENPHCFLGKLCCLFVLRTQGDHIGKPSISLTSFWDILGENQALPECLSLDSVRIKWNYQTWALCQMVCTKEFPNILQPPPSGGHQYLQFKRCKGAKVKLGGNGQAHSASMDFLGCSFC